MKVRSLEPQTSLSNNGVHANACLNAASPDPPSWECTLNLALRDRAIYCAAELHHWEAAASICAREEDILDAWDAAENAVRWARNMRVSVWDMNEREKRGLGQNIGTPPD